MGESGLRRIQVGNRPVALDGMPLLGETELAGLWMMTGTYRDGLTLSPLLAREMAALVLGEETTIDLELFHPVRSPIEPLSRAEVVEATVTHMLATGYESNWITPVAWPSLLEATLVTELYRNPPDVLSEVGTRLKSHHRRLEEPLRTLAEIHPQRPSSDHTAHPADRQAMESEEGRRPL